MKRLLLIFGLASASWGLSPAGYLDLAPDYIAANFVFPASGVSVSFDAAGGGATDVSGTATSISANHTVTNGVANSVVVAVVHWAHVSTGSATVSSCTYNGSSMTQMWNFTETNASIYGSAGYVFSNGTGSGVAHAAQCTFGTAPDTGIFLETASFYNVNQSTPLRASSAVTSSISVAANGLVEETISNAQNGDAVVDAETVNNGTSCGTAVNTSIHAFNNPGGVGFDGCSSYALATGSTLTGYTGLTNGNSAALGGAALAHQ